MVNISDFLEIADRLRAAQDASEKVAVSQELQLAIQAEIQDLFDDPKYPNRRRSFGAIKIRLGIIDDSSAEFSQARLRQILFGMGARVHRGDGDEALWELPHKDEQSKSKNGRSDIRSRSRWSYIYAALGALASIFAILAWFEVTPARIWESVFDGGPIEERTYEECTRAANDTFVEIMKCKEKFGVRP